MSTDKIYFSTKDFPYKIEIDVDKHLPDIEDDNYKVILLFRWIEQNLETRSYINVGKNTFYFRHENDAAHFKLVWA